MFVLSIERNIILWHFREKKERNICFVVGDCSSLRGHVVMSSQNVPGEERGGRNLEAILLSCVSTWGGM